MFLVEHFIGLEPQNVCEQSFSSRRQFVHVASSASAADGRLLEIFRGLIVFCEPCYVKGSLFGFSRHCDAFRLCSSHRVFLSF